MNENLVRKYMWPHVHRGKERICAKFLGLKGVKHGDKVGKGVFRLIENDLYEDEFYQNALPIAKNIWEEENNNDR